MDFNPSELQRMLRDSAERYLGDRFSLEHRRALRASADGLDHEAWATFAELGWLALLIPEDLGGLGGSMTDAAVLASVLGTHCVTEPFASSAVLAATLLGGADSPPADLIGAIAAGSARVALVHDEAGEGVTLSPPAQDCALNGQAMLAIDAPSATHLIVAAHGPHGLALVLLRAGSDGLTKRDYALHDGSRASDIRFDQAKVTPEAVLAEGDAAQSLLALALDRTRVILAAQAVGSMEAELEVCSAYLKERQQFGQPIGTFQSLQHIMADMFVAAHQARSILYFALASIDAPAAERRRAVALARLNISEAGQLVSRQAIQLHGGYGITDEYEVSHHYRRQMVLEKLYGDITRCAIEAER